MDIIGIVGEYNPFHHGHEHHLFATKQLVGNDAPVVCAMSGDFVQRGEAAIYSKFARAEAACRIGVDLVVELPLVWSLSSAEGFARGAVELLAKLGITKLSFGSELGDVRPLYELAGILAEETIYSDIRNIQKRNASLSFASARQLAVKMRAGDISEYLSSPNNILGVEYIKALNLFNPEIEALTIKRVGSGHDSLGDSGPKSASEIRSMICRGEGIGGHVPENAEAVYIKERAAARELSDKSRIEIALVSRLRMLDRKDFANTPDASGGLGDRIYEAVQKSSSLNEIYESANTKRYALSRVRRVCMCAALGIKQGMSDRGIPYARVLAANEKGRALLRSLSEQNDIPVITKPAHIKNLSSESMEVFALGAKAHDLYVLSYGSEVDRKAGSDWRTGPQIVKN